MASPRTSEREEERRFNLRTLVIASAASATAAVLTSQLWIAGTWLAAATTPVLVTLISELLHRPTDRIAERLTTDRPALRRDRVEPSETATPPPADEPAPPSEPAPPREPAPSRGPVEPGPAPVRVYRSSGAQPRRRKIAVGAVLGTSALALLIAVVVLTVPELLAGGAIGKSDSRTTLFRGDREPKSSDKDKDKDKQQAPSKTRDEQQPTEPTTAPRSDEETVTETTTTTTTTPTTQESTATTPAPAPNQQP
jgi:hypothetical protein